MAENSKKILLEDCYGNVSRDRISLLENILNVKLPATFIKLVECCDGGSPTACDFGFFDEYRNENTIDCIGSFLCLNNSTHGDFLDQWKNPPEFFPINLVAFAGTGGGDYLCFDYRQVKNNLDPQIVYWNHEADTGKDVSFVANNFEEFLGMLREPEDE